MSKINTLIISNNNVNPVQQICLLQVDTTVEPNTEVETQINYNTLTIAEKAQYDAFIAMMLSKIPV